MKRSKHALPVVILLLGISILAALSNNILATVYNFKQYSFDKDDISLRIDLPETVNVSEEYFLSRDVLFSAFFVNRNYDFWGYLQVWNISSLEEFLDSSRLQSPFNYTSYSKEPIEINYETGFLIRWTAVFEEEDEKVKTVSAKEYFIKKANSDRVLRVSVFAPRSSFPEELEEVVFTMISSINWL